MTWGIGHETWDSRFGAALNAEIRALLAARPFVRPAGFGDCKPLARRCTGANRQMFTTETRRDGEKT